MKKKKNILETSFESVHRTEWEKKQNKLYWLPRAHSFFLITNPRKMKKQKDQK